ncbi:MAG: EboA domain-containing protein [Acidiferrobacterales bacterium]|nr:EboA domain-containing protein [Acidiferrobacterales bacterium]
MNDTKATVTGLLHVWLERQLPRPAIHWLDDKCAEVVRHPADRTLFLAISLVPRKLGKDDLSLDKTELAAATDARAGWTPLDWSVDQAARLLLLLCTDGPETDFARRLEQLCNTADVGELVTFYRGLPLYPGQSQYVRRAAEGVRSNMKAVFEAVAHHNPYPAEQFDEGAWNQMVLKALFIGSPLQPIAGLDERANPALMRMLCDYAHERWAAGRNVSPELWRCVGPYADDVAITDLEHVLKSGTAPEREAAVLALSTCSQPRAAVLLKSVPDLAARAKSAGLNWATVMRGSG